MSTGEQHSGSEETELRPRLVAVDGPLMGRTVVLDADPFTIGRHPDNVLQLPQGEVSRHHCAVRREGSQWIARDRGSRHGTFVNNVPVGEHRLNHGDVVQIGGSTFLFLLDSGPTPAAGSAGGGDLVARSTVHQRLEETFFLQPARVRSQLPPGRVAAGLHALLEISRALQSAGDVSELGRRLLEQLLVALPAERCSLLLMAPGDELPVVVAASTRQGDSEHFPVSRTVLERVVDDRCALLCRDLELAENGLSKAESLSAAAVHSLLCAPLLARERLLGAIYLDTSRSDTCFGEGDLELLTAAANIASLTLDNLCQVQALRNENQRLQDEGWNHGLVGESPAIKRLLQLIARVAPVDSTVLIRGDSGTGKELVARALHRASRRAGQPFVAVNCATLSETLLESELFGHERGAFTGAVARKIGKLEAADGGTLFLDEVGEIPLPLQARLLRVLQEREIERVGGSRPIAVDIRLVAATNRDLEAAISDGSFRDDLFYRLNVITLQLPPLCQRPEDIVLLARHFAATHGRELRQRVIGLSAEARQVLSRYDWPGNVRQLANAIERAVVLCDGDLIRPEDLPDEVVEAGGEALPGDFQSVLLQTKCRLILDAFVNAGGDLTVAADHLGLHPNSLRRLVRTLGLKPFIGEAARR